MKKIAAFLGGFSVVLLALFALSSKAPVPQKAPPGPPPIVQPPQPRFPAKPNLTNAFPGYQDYNGILRQLDEWKSQSPGLVEVGSYGTTTRGQKLSYIRVTNLLDPAPKKKVLITACIHGNEPLACSTVMGYIGTMLSTYTTDPEVTELINTRDIYFVPVVCPDSYPNSRYCDGVDPNRNFPGPSNPSKQSIKPLASLQTWFLQVKFNAAISGHTFGRVYLTPYGDRNDLCPNNDDYLRIIGKMQSLSNYRRQRACEVYGRPIHGSEVDWYYRNGAFSIVCEFGTHQNIPSMSDTREEFNRTYKGALVFIKEAPLVTIRTSLLELSKFGFTATDVDKRTRLFRPASTVDVLDASERSYFRMMGVPTTHHVTPPGFGKLDSLLFDVFRTPEVMFGTVLRHPRNVMGTVDLLEEPVDRVRYPRQDWVTVDE
jgi:hypothetical protein